MRRFRRILLLLIATMLVSGCALPFYWQAIGGQLELLRKRTPIEKLLEDPKLDPHLRSRLAAVAMIRRFAVTELHLPDNDSYTSYVDLHRPYVVWNVVAADEFSVDPKRWCFPFVGCVAYRGFFDRAKAERFQARLDAQGLDTYSGGSSAYSTLGYFADPVLSTMLDGGEPYVASVLFHELAHQKLYIKGDSDFSEAFATTIEEYGTERWLREHGDAAAVAAYRQRLERRAGFADLISTEQSRLRAIYASDEPPAAKRRAKAASFATMRADYAALRARWGGNRDYDAWFAQPLNNATLAAVATYRHWLPALRWRLAGVGLDTFYAEAAELAKLSAKDRERRLQGWLDAASAAGALPEATHLPLGSGRAQARR
jgi:predicted aminopeptidase